MQIKIIKNVIIDGAVIHPGDDPITVSEEVGNNLLRIECAQEIVPPAESVKVKTEHSTKIFVPETSKGIKKPTVKRKKQDGKTRTKTLNP